MTKLTKQIFKEIMGWGDYTIPGEPIAYHVQLQNGYGRATLWFLHDGKMRKIIVRHTGDYVPDGFRHIGTVLMDDGKYVLHAFVKDMTDEH